MSRCSDSSFWQLCVASRLVQQAPYWLIHGCSQLFWCMQSGVCACNVVITCSCLTISSERGMCTIMVQWHVTCWGLGCMGAPSVSSLFTTTVCCCATAGAVHHACLTTTTVCCSATGAVHACLAVYPLVMVSKTCIMDPTADPEFFLNFFDPEWLTNSYRNLNMRTWLLPTCRSGTLIAYFTRPSALSVALAVQCPPTPYPLPVAGYLIFLKHHPARL